MPYALSPPPWLQFLDANGAPFVGGKLYIYLSGSPSTLASVYLDAMGTPAPNPIILDGFGMCAFYVDPTIAYKYVLTDRLDVPIRSQDNVFIGSSTEFVALSRHLLAVDLQQPPTPDAALYVAKPPVVSASVFHINERPWPAVVCLCGELPYANKPHVHISRGFDHDAFIDTELPVNDGDWIIYNRQGQPLTVVSAADFERGYAPAPTPVTT